MVKIGQTELDDSVETVAAGALAVIASQVLTLGGGDDDGYEYPNDALEIFRIMMLPILIYSNGCSKADEMIHSQKHKLL